MITVVAFDVGIVHLACVALTFESPTRLPRVREFHLVDLTRLQHRTVPRWLCTLGHGNTLVDRVQHFFQEYAEVLKTADFVLIEQQPPGGHQAVEQLLFSEFRAKAHLVSPTGMHAHFELRGLDYEGRKRAVEEKVRPMLSEAQRDLLDAMERTHDVCDAVCLALYWSRTPTGERALDRGFRGRNDVSTPLVSHRTTLGHERFETGDDPFAFLDQFRYIP